MDAVLVRSVEYHDCDFPLAEWIAYTDHHFRLPPITQTQTRSPQATSAGTGSGSGEGLAAPKEPQPRVVPALPVVDDGCQEPVHSTSDPSDSDPHGSTAPGQVTTGCSEQQRWDSFFRNHSQGLFYKPRRYLIREFQDYIPVATESKCESTSRPFTIVEVGCGHGCSIYPLLHATPPFVHFVGTDFSNQALSIMRENKLFDCERMTTFQYDCAVEIIDPSSRPPIPKADIVMAIFCFSAIEPALHKQTFQNMHALLNDDKPGYLLIRDYAEYDFTMFRHTIRLGERLYRRNDGTLVHYFNENDIRDLAAFAGFEVVELTFATIASSNRKSKVTMNRVFLHAVLKKCCC